MGPNKYLILGAIGAGIALVFLAKRGIEAGAKKLDQVFEKVEDVINPINIANNGVQYIADTYKNASPNNTSYGADTRKIWDLPKYPTNEQIRNLPMGAGASLDVYQWLTGSTGNQVKDFNEWWDGIW